ncbi:sulfite exporter TauE/SafE family protein [Microbulbifer harenosus]|uniref:Probable membrane transporter protein n=1 Tax=Microbulbifer harenosus TaxID=2576840 RepID=A0ABY2UMS2_9GAMM|nr:MULTISPECIES: sulfite exporter TauE/SafE family protein [Microbulbifer]QIL89957.1 TSUP family transporter [Microbulbifer sp. SH-1]TLM79905.1 sulfite exporter TauE/SafE family protein [Microbulbifer harenosus]
MEVLLLYLLVGMAAGTIAGLFGVGGGLIIVPALVLMFTAQGIAPEILTHMAVGTSLATIIITSISSIRTHHGKRAVDWKIVALMAPGILVGSWIGGVTADWLSGAWLQFLIGLFAVGIALKMWLDGLRKAELPTDGSRLPGKAGLTVVGAFIGWASAIFGIGGGSLTVPFLSRCHIVMQRAVATSAACGLPIAVAGALSFAVQGWSNPQLPQWSSGYIYWPAFFGIVLASTWFARLGAKLAHRLSPQLLKNCFAGLLFVIGVRFIWLNYAVVIN